MSEFSRETLLNIIETDHVQCGEASALARMALAAMDSEPVAWTDEQELRDVDRGGCGYLFTVNPVTPHADERRIILLYRHAQPVPVVSADLLHTAASAIEDLLTNKDRTGAGVWFDLPFRLRSAANEQTAPVVDADDNFYSWFGREWAENYQHNQYTTAAKQMLGVMAESAWKAGRRAAMLAAAPHDTPALNSVQSVVTVLGKWIPVSERMPEVGVKVLCFPAEDEPIHAVFNGQLWLQDVSWSGSEEPIDNVIPVTVTHWMPLPAGPQEVR
ncbi:TPA: DUF551 domain-containing protein [Klebsiella pneumoniae]